ncbi:glycosyltransferase [Sodalis sp. RH16]|uniref:glycosyltransferase n=1 Tax=Sodalis sp. RH16 TaxID=3394331 RepID=UPI0039B6C4F3
MKLNDKDIYRQNIGIYHNKTHKYMSDKKLTTRLHYLSNHPGDAAANCRANLMLHMLLWVTNAAEPMVFSPSARRMKPAASGSGPAGVFRSPLGIGIKKISLSTVNAAEITANCCIRNDFPVSAEYLSAARLGYEGRDDCITGQSLRASRRADDKNHDNQPGRRWAGIAGTSTNVMTLISTAAMSAMKRLMENSVYKVKTYIDNISLFPSASAVEVPPAPVGNHSLINAHTDNLYYPKKNAAATLLKQNAAMYGFLNNIPIKNQENITLVADLVRDALSYIALEKVHIHELARVLLASVAYYGGSEGENIPGNVAGMVVRRWFHMNVLNDTFENFFTGQLSTYHDLEKLSLLSLGTRLHGVLATYWGNLTSQDGAADKSRCTEELWHRIIIPELPVLEYWQETPFNNISMTSFELGGIQAGLIFARQSDMNIGNISREEAAELGEFVQLQVEAGLAPPQWLLFYQFPALVRFIASREGHYQKDEIYASAVHDALQYYFKEKELYLQASNPFTALSVAMANYKSRTALAEEILNKSCSQVSASEYLLKITPDCPLSAMHSLDSPLAISYMRHNAGATSARLLFFYPDEASYVKLPNIDDVFIAQNKAITEKFSVVERLLLGLAWSTYFPTDDNHWHDVTVDKYVASEPLINPKFGFKYCQTRWFRESPGFYAFPADVAKIILHPETELFVMNRFYQDVLYALTRNNEGYRIIYLLPLQEYASLMPGNGRVSVCLLKTKKILPLSQNFAKLIESLVADHAAQMMNKLYEAGYDKHVLHMAKDFFLSLIPFYSCIDGIAEDEVEETVLDCALDIVSLIPVLGQINQLMSKSGTLLLKGLHTAGRNALTMAAARYTMKDIAARSAQLLLVHSLQPASKIVSLNEMIALAKGAARFMDPGFEIIYFVGKKSFYQAMSVSKHMGKSLPKIKALFERTLDTPLLLPPSAHFDPVFIVTEKGTGRKIGIKRLEDQKYRDREVYAMSNLEAGILFGPKLFLSKKNYFRAIPVKFSEKLKIMGHQGLGGKGGPRAAAKWRGDSMDAAGHAGAAGHSGAADPVNAAGHSGAAGSSDNAGSALRSMSAPLSNTLTSLKAKRLKFNEYGFFVDMNEIRTRINGKATSVIYDLSRNVFYPRKDKTKVETIIEFVPQDNYMINPDGKLEKTNILEPALATPQDQYEGIKALGIDLPWNSSPIKILANLKKNIPRKITSIWVGKNDIPENIIKNLQNNARMAKEFPRPYDFKLYLSSENNDAYVRNLARLKELAKDVVVINLEFTDYYHAFSQTKNFEHYSAAIDGNRGRATNFASACDVIRLDLLNRRGGLYMDVDDTLFLPPGLFDFSTSPEGLILSTPVYHSALNIKGKYPNSNWGTHANNPTLDAMLDESYRRYMSHKEFYTHRPSLEDAVASARYASTLSYLTGPDLFNHIIDQNLANEKQTREALKLLNLPIVMDRSTHAKLEEYWDLEVCALKNIVQVGNAHTWRHSR